ncbi:hypothetical protein CDAR_252221 [Caerostris darwini]|uniref:Uncharacterized protein n=1 Tax=Caerostris darwini TaxID=1538125 RepID=A0AAV4QDQ8_9ARAC|nr:hypothetical protein CDAR_252221 [Caerostris darwini]
MPFLLLFPEVAGQAVRALPPRQTDPHYCQGLPYCSLRAFIHSLRREKECEVTVVVVCRRGCPHSFLAEEPEGLRGGREGESDWVVDLLVSLSLRVMG